MILDERTEFADAAAVAGAAATFNVGDIVDSGDVVRDLGNGQPVYAVFSVDVAPTGADTVELKLVSDATTSIATDGSATQHITTGAVTIAAATVGRKWVFALPQGNTYERYLAFQVTGVGASALADFKVNAFLTLDPTGWVSYPDAVN